MHISKPYFSFAVSNNNRNAMSNQLTLSELKALKLKLTVKAFKTFPNSPKQIKIVAEINEINNKIKQLTQ